jgi:mRNA interferase RelE/StbE
MVVKEKSHFDWYEKISRHQKWHRIRVGDYRILYTIDDRQKIVAIYRIRHRREVYR